MRHAKSNWVDHERTEHKRTLNARGRKDAPVIAKEILTRGVIPDLILVSDSQRTRETWDLIKPLFPNAKTQFTNDLYLASSGTIVKLISMIDPIIDVVLILAHNPGITEAFYTIANVRIDNVPTAGVGCISLHSDNFQNTGISETSLDYFIYPKML